jgi:hypothetical protein
LLQLERVQYLIEPKRIGTRIERRASGGAQAWLSNHIDGKDAKRFAHWPTSPIQDDEFAADPGSNTNGGAHSSPRSLVDFGHLSSSTSALTTFRSDVVVSMLPMRITFRCSCDAS